jgi:hypothetical protein
MFRVGDSDLNERGVGDRPLGQNRRQRRAPGVSLEREDVVRIGLRGKNNGTARVGRDEERRTTARLGLHHDRDGREAGLCPGVFQRVKGAGEEMSEALWSGFVAGVTFIRGRRLLYCHDVAPAVWRPRAACVSRRRRQGGEQRRFQRVKGSRAGPGVSGQGIGWSDNTERERQTLAHHVFDEGSTFRAWARAARRKGTRGSACTGVVKDIEGRLMARWLELRCSVQVRDMPGVHCKKREGRAG